MKTFRWCFPAVLLIGFVVSGYAAQPSQLSGLDFLLGKWEGIGSGKPGEGTGFAEFTKELQDRVIFRRSNADYPATTTQPAFSHNDLLIIYVDDSQAVRADYYDSEGHVIRYTVHIIPQKEATFVSDSVPNAPRYRLSYQSAANGNLDGRFEIAPPGKPDAFRAYLTWTSRRVKPATKVR